MPCSLRPSCQALGFAMVVADKSQEGYLLGFDKLKLMFVRHNQEERV